MSPQRCAHLVQLVEVGRHQTHQLTCANFIQDPTRQLQCLHKIKRDKKVQIRRHLCQRASDQARQPHLLVDEAEEGDANLHAQVMQAKDGRLQKQEACSEEQAEAKCQEVALAALRRVEGVEGGDDAAQELRLHSL